ncbi:unnamed protein product [Parnassius mnemosyne]|uniref:Reverse transcriptase domain-containing protein n=1 Tax=Parnassius mnemosyne TaxID=213953 RepID=A0AAV1KQF4_9NEOP
MLGERPIPASLEDGEAGPHSEAERPADSPSAYRPVVLLDEVGKLFERVIANRLAEHLAGTGPDLAEHQFGFRKRRSTMDAIMRVRALTTGDAVARRGGLFWRCLSTSPTPSTPCPGAALGRHSGITGCRPISVV